MTPKARTDPYGIGPFSMDKLTERDRLLLLEQVKNPDTIRVLESLPSNGSSRCLEIGAGMGSIAYWLAARYPQGHVVAVDIDTRNLDPQRSSNLNIQKADITTCEFAPSSFDLFMLARYCVIFPLVKRCSLAPTGGWLVVEDVYTLPVGTPRQT
ncbi:MAG: class I SAM-dependent methyltransferase [Pseudonocardiaceae bacterium]